jgi:GTPase SAR1 family protein
MKKPNKIRVVLVGDDGTGKTTALKAILEKTKPRLDDPNNHLAVAGGSSSKTATSNGTAKKAAKKKEESSSSDDTDDSDEDNLQLVNEINTKLTSLSLNVDEINVYLIN